MKKAFAYRLAAATFVCMTATSAFAVDPVNPAGKTPQSANACHGTAITCAPEVGTAGAAAAIALVLAAIALGGAATARRRQA